MTTTKQRRLTKSEKRSCVLSKSYSLSRLVDRCCGKRDKECLYRLFKEASIIDQDFETACALRALQFANKPVPRLNPNLGR